MLVAPATDLGAVRRRTLGLIAGLPDAVLERRLHRVMSPLVWDLGHIAAYEDLWLAHRYGGRPLLRPDLATVYDAFETPRAVRDSVELPRTGASLDFLAEVPALPQRSSGYGGGDGAASPAVKTRRLLTASGFA